MPERIFALFAHRDDQRELVQRTFLDAGMVDLLLEPPPAGLSKIQLPDEESAQRLRVAAVVNGLDAPDIQRDLRPTARELAAAALLCVSAGGTGSLRGHPRAGTSYDDANACPECGAGLRQTSPLQVRRTELPKSALAAAAADELLLHESIAAVVEAADLPGVAFREVQGPDGTSLPWRQLVVEHTLPPMLASSRGLIRGRSGAERPCTRCARDGWFDTPSDPYIPAYEKKVLDTMPAAAWAHEMMGTGAWRTPVHGKRWIARRRLIVRPSLYTLLKQSKVRGLRWTPVRVEE